MDIIITSPSLNPNENVSGISSVTQFIINNNKEHRYIHFELGKKDNENGGWHRILALIKKYREWKVLLSLHPNAVIHYNFPLSRASLLRDPWFMKYAWKKGRKMIVHVHGGLFLTAAHIPYFMMRIMKWVFRQNVPFVVLSDLEKDILQKRFLAKDVISLPNCADLTDAENFAQENVIRNELKPLCIGYLGRIEPNKGMKELMFACQRMKKQGVPFKLVIAGKEQTEDEYLPQFKKCLTDSFEYVGLVSGQKKCDFLKSLDAFILPTYFEGLPMALLETMSYGVTPIVTHVGSIPQVVKDGVNGVFIKDHDIDSIVNAIERLNADRCLLRKLGNAARQTIFSQFSPKKYIDELNKTYVLCVSCF